MYNIEINEIELENLIKKLEIDNSKLVNSIENIYNEIKKINKNEWNSSEKDDLDNNFIPYLKEERDLLESTLNSRIDVLKNALVLYKKQNQELLNKANNIEVL